MYHITVIFNNKININLLCNKSKINLFVQHIKLENNISMKNDIEQLHNQ